MRTTPITKVKSKDELYRRLRAVGIEPDTRQDGRPLAFAPFCVAEYDVHQSVGRLCAKLQDHFIAELPHIAYSSPLRTMIFSPVLLRGSSSPLAPDKPIKVQHKRSESAVHIWRRLDIEAWQASNSRARRRLLVRPAR